jgi:hypothetical protein
MVSPFSLYTCPNNGPNILPIHCSQWVQAVVKCPIIRTFLKNEKKWKNLWKGNFLKAD